MSKLPLLSLLPALVLIGLSAACADGREDSGRVPIRRLDFTGVKLSFAEYLDPPFVNQYPEVVAEVNEEPITGEALAARQVELELGRRNLLGDLGDVSPEGYVGQQLAEIDSTDPLEELIDRELERQAAERLGLLPSYEEAQDFARKNEEMTKEALQRASPEDREKLEEMLRLMDLPPADWASDPEYVERYRQQMGVATLRETFCVQASTPEDPLSLSTRRDCSEFLEQEREKAHIRYFVRWAD